MRHWAHRLVQTLLPRVPLRSCRRTRLLRSSRPLSSLSLGATSRGWDGRCNGHRAITRRHAQVGRHSDHRHTTNPRERPHPMEHGHDTQSNATWAALGVFNSVGASVFQWVRFVRVQVPACFFFEALASSGTFEYAPLRSHCTATLESAVDSNRQRGGKYYRLRLTRCV